MTDRCVICDRVFMFSVTNEKHRQFVPRVCDMTCFKQLMNCSDYENLLPNTQVNFRSSYEVKFTKLMNEVGIPYIYEPYFIKVGTRHHYLADFMIPNAEGVIFLEVKGLWEAGAFTKFKAFERKYLAYVIDKDFIKRMS